MRDGVCDSYDDEEGETDETNGVPYSGNGAVSGKQADMRRFRGLPDSIYTITGNRLTYRYGKNGTATRHGGAGNGKVDGMNPYIDKGTDSIIDKAIDELVEWSRLHGYAPK